MQIPKISNSNFTCGTNSNTACRPKYFNSLSNNYCDVSITVESHNISKLPATINFTSNPTRLEEEFAKRLLKKPNTLAILFELNVSGLSFENDMPRFLSISNVLQEIKKEFLLKAAIAAKKLSGVGKINQDALLIRDTSSQLTPNFLFLKDTDGNFRLETIEIGDKSESGILFSFHSNDSSKKPQICDILDGNITRFIFKDNKVTSIIRYDSQTAESGIGVDIINGKAGKVKEFDGQPFSFSQINSKTWGLPGIH